MLALTLGLVSALGWGLADFLARFTGRALGHRSALFGMLLSSALLLSALVSFYDLSWGGGWAVQNLLLVALSGVGLTVATLLLYAGLARGPIAIVSPIVASYPAFHLLLAVAFGLRPSLAQWAAIALTLAGVAQVAGSACSTCSGGGDSRAQLRYGVRVALGSALGFALTISAGQAAAAVYGELQTLLLGRWVALAAALALLIWCRQPPRLALATRWPLLLLLQGLLDAAALMALLAAGQGERGVVATVIGSCFGAVTVLLAWRLLREPISRAQWFGIALIIAGVAALAALR